MAIRTQSPYGITGNRSKSSDGQKTSTKRLDPIKRQTVSVVGKSTGSPAVNGAVAGAKTAVPKTTPQSDDGSNGGYSGSGYTSGGGGSGSGSGGGDDSGSVAAQQAAAQAAALKAAQQARLDAINAANNALNEQGRSLEAQYRTSLGTIGNDYQKLRNQSEVNRYRAMINQREALANRGALDSGAGRQENLMLSNNYNNNLNEINLQEAAERAKVQNNINSMWSQIRQQQAQNQTATLNDYANALQNIVAAQYSGYNPENSDYYKAAQEALGVVTPTVNYVSPNTNLSAAAATQAQQDNEDAYTRYLRAMGYGQYVR